MSILENIHGHKDLNILNASQRKILCQELRDFLVSSVSQTGGHMASNLGVVELTVAIETVFDTEKDRLVFDVGHQSYIHKLLTDRQADFCRLRQYGGIAGFPKPGESNTDAFIAGHASSSVSIALGMARARSLQEQNYHVIALMGDGAATGGMAYEGLNDAGDSGEPLIVVLNDNALSIDRNVGGLATHLGKLRTKERYLGLKKNYRKVLFKIPGGRWLHSFTSRLKARFRRMIIPNTIFENMGFSYLGPVDGHDTEHLINLLRIARDMKRPVLLHVMTQKGKGYGPAQEHPKLFHGIGKFDPATGAPLAKSGQTFSDTFGKALCALAEKDSRICAVTAAMPGGTGLLDFKQAYPQRLFDVGIAEEHAVSMAAGLAKQGMIPVVALYSTFLQRAYDMILQDICLLGLPVVLAVDRAGLVGEDGETHHGVFDMGFLSQAPGMRVLCPGSQAELSKMLAWAVQGSHGPVAIRYPRGEDRDYTGCDWEPAKAIVQHRAGADITLITYGTLLQNAMETESILGDSGIKAGVIRLLEASPLPVEEIASMLPQNHRVLILEEAIGGIAGGLMGQLAGKRPDLSISCLDLGTRYIPHGSLQALYRHCGLDAQSIAHFVQEAQK